MDTVTHLTHPMAESPLATTPIEESEEPPQRPLAKLKFKGDNAILGE